MRKAGSRKVPGDSPNPRSVLLSVKLDALSLPTFPHKAVILSSAGREKVGPRREMGVVETVHRHASATVEANPLLGPAIPTPLVVFGSVYGKEVLATPPVIETIEPVSVYLCTAFSGMKFNEKTMVAWVGLRGAVPIILATFPFVYNIGEYGEIFNVVFFIVFISALTQGVSLGKVAELLGLSKPLGVKKRYPIEFERMEGINADLFEIVLPAKSRAIGRKIVDLNLPQKSLIALISRGDSFLIPNGSTVVEDGDIFLALGTDSDLADIQKIVTQTDETEEK